MFYTFDTDTVDKLLNLVFNQLEEQNFILRTLSEKVDNLADLSKKYEFDIKEDTDFQDLFLRTQDQEANINSLKEIADYIYRNEVKLAEEAEEVGESIKSTTAAHNRIDGISAMNNREMSRISNIENQMTSKINNIETQMKNKDMEFNDFKNRVREKLGI